MIKREVYAYGFIGYSLFVLMTGTNLPTPLYSVYKQQLGFSAFTLTVIFAVYALMIIPSLLLFGQLSDRVGRKQVLIPGLVLAGVGSLLLACAHSVFILLVARAIQGISIGVCSGAATAALSEHHPRRNLRQAALLATVATAAGSAVGPFLAGLLAQYCPWPTVLPYVVHLFLLAIGLAGLCFLKEDHARTRVGRWRPQRPAVPAKIRPAFTVAACTAFVAWAVTALFMSLVPTLATIVMNMQNLAIGGGLVFLMLVVSSAAQLSFRGMQQENAISVGLLCLVLGLGCVIESISRHSTWLLFAGTIVAGFGQGLNFMGSLALVNQLAPADRRADVLSSFYVVIYLGVGVPIVAIGVLAQVTDLYQAVRWFGEFVGTAGVLLSLLILTKRRIYASKYDREVKTS